MGVCYTNSGFLKKGTNWLFSFMFPILSQTKALDLCIKGNVSGNKNILMTLDTEKASNRFVLNLTAFSFPLLSDFT